jgi:hypothetical protein
MRSGCESAGWEWSPEQGTAIMKSITNRVNYRRRIARRAIVEEDVYALKNVVRGLQPRVGRSLEEPYLLETPDEAVVVDPKTGEVAVQGTLTCDQWMKRCGNPHLHCLSTDTTFNTNSHGVNKKMVGWETQQKQRLDLAIAFCNTDTADDYFTTISDLDTRAQGALKTP